MRFARTFGISPLDWPEQPVDVVAHWSRMMGLEIEAANTKAEIERLRGLRKH